jgi:hypothetical protein
MVNIARIFEKLTDRPSIGFMVAMTWLLDQKCISGETRREVILALSG